MAAFVTRLDDLATLATVLEQQANALEDDLRAAAHAAGAGAPSADYWAALSKAHTAMLHFCGAARLAREAATDCAIHESTRALPADTSEADYEAEIERVVRRRAA